LKLFPTWEFPPIYRHASTRTATINKLCPATKKKLYVYLMLKSAQRAFTKIIRVRQHWPTTRLMGNRWSNLLLLRRHSLLTFPAIFHFLVLCLAPFPSGYSPN